MTVTPRWRIALRTLALVYLALLLLIPVGVVFWRTFEPGLGAVWGSVTTPAAISAFWLTVTVTAIAVPLNTIFGILTALVLVRSRVRGRRFLEAIIDLPFAVSPVVIGLSLILLYGRGGWFGDELADARLERPVEDHRHGDKEHGAEIRERDGAQRQAASHRGAPPIAQRAAAPRGWRATGSIARSTRRRHRRCCRTRSA